MTLQRHLLPDPIGFFENQGLTLQGRGKWRTTRCDEHGGSDSMRIHVESGAHVCMGCGVKGGDVIAWVMRTRGLEFAEACQELGAWVDDGRGRPARDKPLPFSARSALEVVKFEMLLVAVTACNLAKGIELATGDRERLVQAASRIQFVAEGIGS